VKNFVGKSIQKRLLPNRNVLDMGTFSHFIVYYISRKGAGRSTRAILARQKAKNGKKSENLVSILKCVTTDGGKDDLVFSEALGAY